MRPWHHHGGGQPWPICLGLFTSVRFLTTAIASEMSYASYGSLQRNALYSIGLVLFLFIMLINVILNVFIKNKKEA